MPTLDPAQSLLLDQIRMLAELGAAHAALRSYASIYDYVLERGTFEQSIAPAPQQRAYLRAAMRGARHRLGECFANAQRLATENDRLTYREGYAVAGTGLAVLHAWVVLDSTVVVDVTWRGPRGHRIVGAVPTATRTLA
jgi:hypothetical protein